MISKKSICEKFQFSTRVLLKWKKRSKHIENFIYCCYVGVFISKEDLNFLKTLKKSQDSFLKSERFFMAEKLSKDIEQKVVKIKPYLEIGKELFVLNFNQHELEKIAEFIKSFK